MITATQTLVPLAAFVLTVLGTGGALRWLERRRVLDRPNARSSHTRATPRGGGLALVPVLVVAWWATPGAGDTGLVAVCLLALALAGLSFVDDLRGLPAVLRLFAQTVAVVLALSAMPDVGAYISDALPRSVDLALAGVIWIWFINLFNFMDGIDGISGVETMVIGGGVALVAAVAGLDGSWAIHGLTAATAAAGFLCWNWAPARLFLGDVGSVALGFLLGWLLLSLSARGLGAAALILPAYYLADATLTLARRLARGESPLRAHKEHAYQRAVAAGWSHAGVSALVGLGGLGLVGAAWVSVARPVAGLVLGAIVTGGLLALLGRGRAP
ncbi:MAG: glycosyltransferase family 4 protein [Rhodobacterales bacterium]|nr:glycosyltransferase family 4 protein [Rhodobacterales bacterium]